MKPRGLCLPLALALMAAQVPCARAQSPAETRVLNYIHGHLQPGQPLRVTDLYNRVFTKPDERRALDKLYQAFFRMPLFIAQYQQKFGRPPSLQVIAQQFALGSPWAAGVLIDVMESDPRVPHFITRDPRTGEITRVDVKTIESNPRFSQGAAHRLGGWNGQPAPAFALPLLGGGEINSASLEGKAVLLYVWFTGCPPCMKEAPVIEKLHQEFEGRGLETVGANADGVLHLGYADAVRERYVHDEKITFPVAEWSPESDRAFGNISIFPTLFLMDRKGVVAAHWVGFTSEDDLRSAIRRALAP